MGRPVRQRPSCAVSPAPIIQVAAEPKTVEEFCDLITAARGGGVLKITETGELLEKAKEVLGYKRYGALVKKLGYGDGTDRKLRAIARHNRIRAHAHVLPPCWTTLYELTRLSGEAFDAGMQSGAIYPGTQRSVACALLKRDCHKPLPLVVSPNGYEWPKEFWEATENNIWDREQLDHNCDTDWKKHVPEDGLLGPRAGAMHTSSSPQYSGTFSRFPGAVADALLMRYGDQKRNRVIDPFAGGAIRGAVAAVRGFEYHGVDIWPEIIEENRGICSSLGVNPHYHLGDGTTLDCVEGKFGFAVTCPPYWKLEDYSGQETCLATAKTYEEFNARIAKLPLALRSRLEPGAFACIVVADITVDGILIDLPGDTIANFKMGGFIFHQRIVLVDPFGSGPRRKGRLWETAKKLVRRDQHVLVFKTPHE